MRRIEHETWQCNFSRSPAAQEDRVGAGSMGHHAGIYGNHRLSWCLHSVAGQSVSATVGAAAGLRLMQQSGRFTSRAGSVQLPGDSESNVPRTLPDIRSPAVRGTRVV